MRTDGCSRTLRRNENFMKAEETFKSKKKSPPKKLMNLYHVNKNLQLVYTILKI